MKKSVSAIEMLLFLVLSTVIVLILFLVVNKHTSKYGSFFEKTTSSLQELNKCYVFCMSSPSKSCEYQGKEISCSLLLHAYSNIYDATYIEDSLSSLGIDEDNVILTSGSSKEHKCKMYDFLNPSPRVVYNNYRVPSEEDIRSNVERTIFNYGNLIKNIANEEGIDPCLLVSVIAIESSGGKIKKTSTTSCGITMVTPKNLKALGYCKKEESDDECCDRISKDDKSAIIYGAKMIKISEKSILPYLLKYPLDDGNIFKLAYIFAYYNGGENCMKPSKDCSFNKCRNLKEDTFLSSFTSIPAFMCAYSPGGCAQTQVHVTKSLYAYKICKLEMNF